MAKFTSLAGRLGAVTSSANVEETLGFASAFTLNGTAVPTSVHIFRRSGTLSNMQGCMDNVGTGRSVISRKNSTDQTMVLSFPDTTQAYVADTTHTVSVAAGDQIGARRVVTGNPNHYFTGVTFEADGPPYTVYGVFNDGIPYSGTGTGTFENILGLTQTGLAAVASVQHKVRVPGNVVNFFVTIATNSVNAGANITLGIGINGSMGSNQITIGSGLTGAFEDTAHTDTIANGDLMHLAVSRSGGTSGNWAPMVIGYGFMPSGMNQFDQLGGMRSTFTGGTTQWWLFGGRVYANTTSEAVVKAKHYYPVMMQNLRFYIDVNSCTSTCTITLRINGANGNQVVSVGAGLTGWFEDTTNVDHAEALDDVNFQCTGGTSGSMNVNSSGMTETQQSGVFLQFMA